MPKESKALSDVQVRKLTFKHDSGGIPKPDRHPVGGVAGLHLYCKPSGSRSWVLRVKIGDKRKDIGLGSYPSVSLKTARELAREHKLTIKSGNDPIAEQRAKKEALLAEQSQQITFEEFARKFIAKESKTYKTPQQVRHLSQRLRDFAFPYIGHLYIKDIKRKHLIAILEPIWETKNHTAKRVQNYVYRILQQAISEELRTDANPATWKDNLALSFPKASKIAPVKHHRAIDWRKLPEFMKTLRDYDDPVDSHPEAKCFEFMILTAARAGEARLVTWDELDLTKKIWRVPAGKYKSNLQWEIPLTDSVIRLLRSLPSYKTQAGNVFSTLSGGVIPDAYMSSLPDALGFDAVAHGFRTTFRTWGQERQRFSEEALELSLKHCETVGTRAAYARSQLVDERRQVLDTYNNWAKYGKQINNVTSIRGKSSK
jgi:integrase